MMFDYVETNKRLSSLQFLLEGMGMQVAFYFHTNATEIDFHVKIGEVYHNFKVSPTPRWEKLIGEWIKSR